VQVAHDRDSWGQVECILWPYKGQRKEQKKEGRRTQRTRENIDTGTTQGKHIYKDHRDAGKTIIIIIIENDDDARILITNNYPLR
jgi:hypothetical protein